MDDEKTPKRKGKIAEKKGLAKIADNFLEEDLHTVVRTTMKENVVPGIKEVLANTLNDAISMMLFGETRTAHRTVANRGNSIIYESIYNSRKALQKNSKPATSKKDRYKYQQVRFETRDDANDALLELQESISEYGKARVLELYEAAGIDTVFTDDDYGWYDISSAMVSFDPGGDEDYPYILHMPRPVSIA